MFTPQKIELENYQNKETKLGGKMAIARLSKIQDVRFYFTSCINFLTNGEIKMRIKPAIRAYIANCLYPSV